MVLAPEDSNASNDFNVVVSVVVVVVVVVVDAK